jgi:hypothetical protein
LAFATHGGISDDALTLPSALASSAAAALLSVEGFDATLADFWLATFFEAREACLVNLLSAIGAPAVTSELVAVLVSGAACDGAAKHTKSPVASSNAERPLALIIGISPCCPAPESARRPHGVSTAGQKKGIFGRVGRKLGNRIVPCRHFPTIGAGSLFVLNAAGVRLADQCYEPAGAKLSVGF